MTYSGYLILGLMGSTALLWVMWQRDTVTGDESKPRSLMFKSFFSSLGELWGIARVVLVLCLFVVALGYSYNKISKYIFASRDLVIESAKYCNARTMCAEYQVVYDACSTNDDPSRCLIGRLGSTQKQNVEFICKPNGSLRVESKYASLSNQDCFMYRMMERIYPR